jgi:hypothetical protein
MGTYDKDLFVDRSREVDGFCRLLRRETTKAVWLIAAGKAMGKTWLIERLAEDCRASVDESPGGEGTPAALAVVDFGNRYEVHEFQDTLSFVRLLRNKLDYPQFFGPLNDVIERFTGADEGSHLSALSSLAKKMGDSFSLEALDILAADLDVDYENLPGGNVKQRKALELARELQRRDRILQLIEKLEYERDHVDWRQGMEPLLGEPTSPGAVAAAAPATGSYSPLRADSDREREQAERQINDAFFACLKTLTAEVHPVILIFDAWEQAPAEIAKWVKEELLERLGCRELEQVVVLVAAREPPDLSELSVKELVARSNLDPFDDARVGKFVKAYTAKYHLEIPAEDIPNLRRYSGGKPGKLADMVQEVLAEKESQDPFFL